MKVILKLLNSKEL